MKISIETLKDIASLALDSCAISLEGGGVVLDHQYYWRVPDDQAFDMSTEPHDLEVGDLFDDFSELQRDAASGEHLGAVSIQRIASLLSWLSIKMGT